MLWFQQNYDESETHEPVYTLRKNNALDPTIQFYLLPFCISFAIPPLIHSSGVALISTESAELLRRALRPRRTRNDRGILLEIRRVISPSKFDGKLENTFLGRGYCYFSLL